MHDSDAAAPDGVPRRNFYGRRRGRPLRDSRRRLIDEVLPRLAIRPDGGVLDPATLFDPGISRYWLEIGFGGGEHLAAQAAANPGVGIIGCEIFVNGIASALSHLEAGGIGNVRIYPEDVRDILGILEPQRFERVFLLFPDPWPKARHAGRRFVSRANLDIVARLLKPGGEFRIGSDDPVHIGWALAETTRHPAFRWLAGEPADWLLRPADWPPTRYEQKAIREGRQPHYFRFERT